MLHRVRLAYLPDNQPPRFTSLVVDGAPKSKDKKGGKAPLVAESVLTQ